jgi:hypothetical protein
MGCERAGDGTETETQMEIGAEIETGIETETAIGAIGNCYFW